MKSDLPSLDILSDPLRNKGTAFTDSERTLFSLHGKLPFHVSTLEEQVQRRYLNFQAQSSPLAKHLFLSALHGRNTTLFYQLVLHHIQEMLPLIYTPTIGEYSLNFSHLYTESRGLYLSYPLQDRLDLLFSSFQHEPIDVIVITDGQRILGLGDLGVGGMAIPIGKLSLYTLFGGIHPRRTLPILIDVGTDNTDLLNDPLYLGWRHSRITGDAYDAFLDQIITLIKRYFPQALLQWEDFGKEHAAPLLKKYQQTLCSFNDDIQGTASVVLAALHIAVKLKQEKLSDQKIVICGGGSAGMGICHYLIGAMQTLGISQEAARKCIYIVDVNGLVHTQQSFIPEHQLPFARDEEEIKEWKKTADSYISLSGVVHAVKPHILIGVSAQPNVFTEEIIRCMGQNHKQPIIFPLSNPTSKSEAHPEDLLKWTEGRAIIATGSPYPPVFYEGKYYPIAQCNNAYIFPGIGLGLVASKALRATDRMFYKAAEVLSCYSPLLQTGQGSFFPSFESLRTISEKIALATIEVAEEEGLCCPTDAKSRQEMIQRTVWTPSYEEERASSATL
ncbi:MAG: NAD-dependent malic enzyme [Candidatus Rhabdochlamydia sp.]